jgi:hypothetical protein
LKLRVLKTGVQLLAMLSDQPKGLVGEAEQRNLLSGQKGINTALQLSLEDLDRDILKALGLEVVKVELHVEGG